MEVVLPAELKPSAHKPATTALFKAMHAARMSMKFVGKSGDNTFDKYRYSTLADYLDAIQAPLDEHGLIVINDIEDIEWLPDRTTTKGGSEHCVRIMLRTRVIHAETGEQYSICTLGEGQDRGDKAFYKADTGARKYALANLFNLATDDDPERDATPPAKTEPAKAPQPAARHREAPPVATANLTPPPDWPNSPVHDLTKWIDATLKTTAHFKFALGLFKNEVGLYSMLAEWEPVLRHLGAAYKRVLGPVPREKRDSALEQEIAAEFTKLDLDKQSKDTFQPAETPAS